EWRSSVMGLETRGVCLPVSGVGAAGNAFHIAPATTLTHTDRNHRHSPRFDRLFYLVAAHESRKSYPHTCNGSVDAANCSPNDTCSKAPCCTLSLTAK